jgi:hypothetical protein
MRRILVPIATLALASAACSEGGSTFVPVASPRRMAWQQFCEQAWNVPQASALVAARGAEGWELVAMYNGALCYKRPVESSPPRPWAPSAPSASPTSTGAVPASRDPGF